MKKIYGIWLTAFVTLFLASSSVLAQNTNDYANITDLMGERPGNSYYQNPSNSAQTQGSGSSTGSAKASVLQQPSIGKLKVDAPAPTVTPISEKKASNWQLFALLAVIFFVAGVGLFVFGVTNTKKLEEALAKEALATKKAPKTKKVTTKAKKEDEVR
jgi:hypothetical protein